MPAPDLPQEIIALILDNLPATLEDAKRYSLVAKAWNSVAQQHAFRKIRLDARKFNPDPESTVHKKMGKYVMSLALMCFDENISWRAFPTASTLLFPRLSTLALQNCPLSHSIKELNAHFPLAQLQHLCLIGCTVTRVEHLEMGILSHLRKVSSIVLTDNYIRRQGHNPAVQPWAMTSIAPFIEQVSKPIQLIIRPKCKDPAFWMACSAIPGLHVQSLWISTHIKADAGVDWEVNAPSRINDVFKNCCQTLTCLSLEVGDFAPRNNMDLSLCDSLEVLQINCAITNSNVATFDNACQWLLVTLQRLPNTRKRLVVLAFYFIDFFPTDASTSTDSLCEFIQSQPNIRLQVFSHSVSTLALSQPDRAWRDQFLRHWFKPLLKSGAVSYVSRNAELRLQDHKFSHQL